MKPISWVRGILGVFLFLLLFQTGCQTWSSSSPVSPEADGSGLVGAPGSTASVRFQIVLPPASRTGITGLSADVRKNVTISVTFTIILINIGNTTTPTTTFVQTVTVDGSGNASATFNGLPPKTCVGDIHITNGSIASISDFRGATDLAPSASNTLFVGPKGGQGKEDVLAEVILRVASDPALFARATEGLAQKIETNLTGLDLLATNSYTTVLDSWTSKMNASAPANVKCQVGDSKNTISWDIASGATSYNIYWSNQPGVTKKTGTPLLGKTSPFDHTSLTNGTPYYYIVTSVSSLGESVDSLEVAGLPAAGTVTGTTTGTNTGTTVGVAAIIPLNQTVASISQNVQVILTGVPSNFSSSIGLTDVKTGSSFYLMKSSALSWPNYRKVTLVANGATTRTAAPFNSLGFTTAPPAGASIEVFDPDTNLVVASATVAGGGGAPVALGQTVTGLNQNLQLKLTRVPSTFDVTATMIDRNTREEVSFAKSATLSFPNFQQLLLTTSGMALRSFDNTATVTFSAALPAGARLELYDADRQLTLASVDIPSGSQSVALGATITGATQNLQIIITGVSNFDTSTSLFDNRTGESVVLAKSAALSSTTRLLLGVTDMTLRTIRPFSSLRFTTAVPTGATITVYDAEVEKTLATVTIP